MAEYIDKAEYCEKHCRCSNEYCDRQSCPIWEAPAADAAPVVHGRWVLHYTAIGAPYTECSRCCTDIAAPMVGGGLLKLDMREMPYCPICGAQMDGGEAT